MEKPTIRIGHLTITDHLVLGVTKYNIDNGIETFNHCNIETIPMMGWDYVGDAISNGELDAAFILAPYAMELFHSGEKIQLVLLGHKTGSVVIKNKKVSIKNFDDFRGKTMLIPFHLSIHMMLLHKLFAKHGLDVGPGKDVSFEVMAPAQIPQAMEWDEDGELGGFIVAEPYGSLVVKNGYGTEFALSKDLWPDHPCCVFIVKDEIIQKYPDAVQELVTSFTNAGKYIAGNVDKVAENCAEFLNQEPAIIKQVLTSPPDRVKYSELMPRYESFETIQKYMTENVQSMSGKINLQKFIRQDFAKNAGAV